MAQSVHEYFVVYEYYCPSSVCITHASTSYKSKSKETPLSTRYQVKLHSESHNINPSFTVRFHNKRTRYNYH